MEIQSITAPAFARYGQVVTGYDFPELLDALRMHTPRPADRTVYVPEEPELQELPIQVELSERLYGGMPIQLGYCNGHNRILNCLEYHRGSELNVAADDVVLLLAPMQEIVDGKIDTAKVEAFLLPAGQAALLYETTLHYAPCTAEGGDGFRVAIVLPQGTNTAKPEMKPGNGEDTLLWAANKWLLAHPDAPEAAQGAHVGLTGRNITL